MQMFSLEASGSSFLHFRGWSEDSQLRISLYFLCRAPSVPVLFLITFPHPGALVAVWVSEKSNFQEQTPASHWLEYGVWGVGQTIYPAHWLSCQQQPSTRNLGKNPAEGLLWNTLNLEKAFLGSAHFILYSTYIPWRLLNDFTFVHVSSWSGVEMLLLSAHPLLILPVITCFNVF